MIYNKIDALVEYGIRTGLIKEADKFFVRNRLLTKLGLDDYEESDAVDTAETLEEILDAITDYAVVNGMLESDSIVYRDIFDTEIMETLTPFPSTCISISLKPLLSRYSRNFFIFVRVDGIS
ncbi:MAG: hypothetical protein UD759_03200, partial [Clostridia bacterium]|nr:hypothetical protein [Clostridia bacterium]